MSKILVIEDEANIRRVISYDLKNAGYEVDECDNGDDAIKLINNSYDLLIIDWMLPNLSGIDIIKFARENKINSKLIMLTAKDDEIDILTAFEAGADDYIIKPFSPRELVARVKAHLRYKPQNTVTENIIKYSCIEMDLDKRIVKIDGNKDEITKTEFDLLFYLINNKNIVLTRDKILNDIWGFDYDGDTRIVDVHISKLRNKLKDTKVYIKTSRGVGYMIGEENE